MSFYLKPPKGETNLHMLLECVQQRITCYNNLQNDIDFRDIDTFEYLIEDSILDRTSHFIFRLGVLRQLLPKQIFVQNELKLLHQRLICYEKNDFEHLLKNINRQLKDCIRSEISKQLSDYYWTLFYTISRMLEKGYLSHVHKMHANVNKEDSSCNEGYSIQVPFQYCSRLIAARKVNLKNGFAIVDCYQWKEILPAFFESYLQIILKEMKYSRNVRNTLSDYRILGCLEKIRNHFSTRDAISFETISLKDLKKESLFFPLCMKTMYDSLKLNHRLTHNERFSLSLFLKDIGLSLDDSIEFWKREYVKKQSSCSKCIHSWQDNEKKYIYGIRHLYGLEGSRKKYSAKSCNELQTAELRINCGGGCPFVSYDDDCLRSVLKKSLRGFDDDIEVLSLKEKKIPAYLVNCSVNVIRKY
ncbi:hypothetical protein WA026_023316 [Henosepilachna vigintioctopunctata]|uniref:DNA primase large subunit C-terminal domain-containing protein n=1 Tax=Henosepilachna vigintioctopunctata TaxID=420089 RepID=A0AAW1UQX6_9CUCU